MADIERATGIDNFMPNVPRHVYDALRTRVDNVEPPALADYHSQQHEGHHEHGTPPPAAAQPAQPANGH
jgi:hypothetical protein